VLAPRPRSRRLWLLPLLIVLVAGGGTWIVSRWGLEETDNAQLEADLTEISSRVPGTIERVAVQDNQQVRAGDLLVELDSRDARAQLLQAEADLGAARQEAQAQRAQAESTVSRAAAAGSEARATQEVAAAELQRAGVDLRRLRSLVRQGGVSQQEADRAEATYARAQGAFLSSRASQQSADASRSQIGVDRQKAAAAASKVKQAEAARARARLLFSYMRINAPRSGRIGARTAEPGRQVQPGQPLMTLVSNTPWVEAHFKETQLDALYQGQPAEVRIDAFPGRVLRGRVVSLAPASGARFALLPPDNSTGNFTKVVQRITARIALEDGMDMALRQRLVPGLSASVSVRRR
jgi:membrane fusion protein (multidrug efflux system)